jgi:diguanylate cyclase (GGDEF)-like protein
MKKFLTFIIIGWIFFVFLFFGLEIYHFRKHQEELLLNSGRSLFHAIVLIRKWNALHKGVYVPVTKETPPNPYLKDPLRDIKVSPNLTLTKINPAYMTRQLSELFQKEKGVQIRITSLKPLNPKNKPTPLEKKALLEFEKGKKEVFKVYKARIFYMAPLITKKECLQCHQAQGYKEGDIRGGLSVYLPFSIDRSYIFHLFFIYLFIAILGIIPALIVGRKYDELYEKYKELSIFDPLTGLFNRREFDRRQSEEVIRAQRYNYPLSVVMCDIDWFKAYNDTYGHQKGDEILKKIAQILKDALLRKGDFVARYGGEEFVIILPHTDEKGARKVCERIKNLLDSLNLSHPTSPYKKVTLSFGIFTMHPGLTFSSSQKLVELADKALYKAKEKGRNQIEIFQLS